MRDLKFRVWDAGRKEWLHKMPFALYGETTLMGYIDRRPDDSSVKCAELKDLVPLQFTGLLDQSGTEIYEGDIVVKNEYLWFDDGQPNYRGTVQWMFSQWQVVPWCVNPNKSGISDGVNEGLNDEGVEEGHRSDWIVLGNIYDNRDLLPETYEP